MDEAITAQAQTAGAPPSPPESQAEKAAADADGRVEKHGAMVRSAFIVGAMTILSRVLGLWRFRLMGGLFGASYVNDAFNFAFIFPNLTRRLFGEGALTSVFVPVFSERLAHDKKSEAFKTASVLICRLTYWLSLGTIACIAVSFALRHVYVSATPERFDLEMKLFEVMLPYCVFINLAAIMMAVLNSMNHYWMPAFAPVLLNAVIIAACLWGLPLAGTLPQEQVWAVAIAVLIGGVAQLIVQVPPALARGFRFTVSMDKTDPGYREMMDQFKPVVLMVAVFQINVMMDNIIARTMVEGEGPVTYLNMGTSVYQLPWSVFSLALATVALPSLSALWAKRQTAEFGKALNTVLRYSIFIMVPCTAGICLLSEDITRLLYGTGKFLANDAEPVKRTAAVAMYSSMGLVFFSVNAMLARALYAMKDMRTPAVTSAKSVAINIVLNVVFVKYTPLKEAGIALASTISNAWQTWALARATNAKIGAADSSEEATLATPRLDLRFTGALVFTVGASVAAWLFSPKLIVLVWANMNEDSKSLVDFFASIAAAIMVFSLVSGAYLQSRVKEEHKEGRGVPDPKTGRNKKEYSEQIRLENAIFSALQATMLMSVAVWAIRDSLPPEGRTFGMVLQRALAPVLAGMLFYVIACGWFTVHEYDEIKAALFKKFKR